MTNHSLKPLWRLCALSGVFTTISTLLLGVREAQAVVPVTLLVDGGQRVNPWG